MTTPTVQYLLEYAHKQVEMAEADGIRWWEAEFDRYLRNYQFDLCNLLLRQVKWLYDSLCESCQAHIRLAEGELRHLRGDRDSARSCYVESLRLLEALHHEVEQTFHGSQAEQLPSRHPRAMPSLIAHKVEMARCWHQLGKLSLDEGNLEAAEQDFQRAIYLHSETNTQEGLAVSLVGQASVCRLLGKYVQANKAIEQALAITQRIDSPASWAARASALHDSGLIYLQLGKFESAKQQFESSLAIAKRISDHEQVAAAHHQLGELHQAAGNYAQALQEYDTAIAVEVTIDNRVGVAALLHQRGMLYQDQDNYPAAKQEYLEALAWWLDLGERLGEAQTRHQLGTLYFEQGAYSDAQEQYELSLAIVQDVGDRAGEVWTVYQLGLLYQELGNDSKAQESYRASAELALKLGDKIGSARALRQLGSVLQLTGQYSVARTVYEDAISLHRETGNQIGEATTRYQLGTLYLLLDEPERARKNFEESLAISRMVDDKPGEVMVLCQIGMLHYEQGDPDAAQQAVSTALNLWKDAGPKSGQCIATALTQLGLAYEKEGLHILAVDQFKSVLSVWQELHDRLGEAQTRFRLGKSYEALGSLGNAQEQYEMALALATDIQDNEGMIILQQQLDFLRTG